MAELILGVPNSSQLKLRQQLWVPYYEAALKIGGTGMTILPLIDPNHGGLGTAFSTIGDEQVTFTWNEAVADFDTAPSFQGIFPVVTFNDTDEEADTPDAAFWTRALAAATWGAWINLTGSRSTVLAKYDGSGSQREFYFWVDANLKPELVLVDEDDAVSPNATISSMADAALSLNTWIFVLATYDGSADASGINLYVDGALVASTDTDDANFASMRDKTAVVNSANLGGDNFFDGMMAGGSAGPFFDITEWSADQVLRYFQLMRKGLML